MPFFPGLNEKLAAWTATKNRWSVKQVAAADNLALRWQDRMGLPLTGTPVKVGDPLPSQSTLLKNLRRSLAGLDDLVFRPLLKLSPGILGFGVGWVVSFGWKVWLGVSLLATVGPSGWYTTRFAQGMLGGALASSLWSLDWALAKPAALSLGAGNQWRLPFGGPSLGF